MNKFEKVFSFLVLSSVLLWIGGCVTERDPIDRSPKEAIDKKMFEGEFLYKQTIVDLPYTVDYTFVGETNEAKIIKWEITKNWLIAYNIHDKFDTYLTPDDTLPDSTPSGDLVPNPNRTPVLAFPIADHFDITYADNATTGEDMPLIVANHDREWYESRYFVIDFSTNYITSFELDNLNMSTEWENPFHREPMTAYTRMEFYDIEGNYLNPRTWRTLKIDEENRINTVEEMNFYTEEMFTPNANWNGIYNWGDVFWFINREPARIKYRHHFVAIDSLETKAVAPKKGLLNDHGFVPIDMQDEIYRKYGYFRTTKTDYCTEMGIRDKCVHYYANYFNITGDNKITYYLSPNMPKYLIPAACDIAADYNDAFKRAYYALNNADDGTGAAGDKALVSSEPTLSDVYNFKNFADMTPAAQAEMIERCLGDNPAVAKHAFKDPSDKFILAPQEFLPYDKFRDGIDGEGKPIGVEINPCEYYPVVKLPAGYTHDMCFTSSGAVNTEAPKFLAACVKDWTNLCEMSDGKPVIRYKHELGSIRDSFIYWVDVPTEYGILGVAQWTANPETGQTYSGVGHIAGWVVYWQLVYALDLYDILAGYKTIDNVMYPDYGTPVQKFVETVQLPYKGPNNTGMEMTPEQKLEFDAKFANKTSLDMVKELQTKFRSLKGRLDINAVKGTKFEKYMRPSSYVDYLSDGAEEGVSDELLGMADPTKLFDVNSLMEMKRRNELLTQRCYFQPEWLDGVVALYVAEKMKDVDKLKQDLLAKNSGMSEADAYKQAYETVRETVRLEFTAITFKGVAEHEIGHSIGLRHNFKSSADQHSYKGNAWWDKGEPTQYWEERNKLDPKVDEFIAEYKNLYGAAPSGKQIYDFKHGQNPECIKENPNSKLCGFNTMAEKYMYASVMDYQNEAYIHSVGLGKYDYAAIKYVYGRAFEKYAIDSSDNTKLIRKSYQWADKKGGLKTVEGKIELRCNDYPDHVYDWDKRCPGGFYYEVLDPVAKVNVTENGDAVPYIFSPDEYRWEDPMTDVFDAGANLRDSIRYKADMYNQFYYYRFFRRGNPKFDSKQHFHYGYFGKIMRFFKFVHPGLDFNYNLFYHKDFTAVMIDQQSWQYKEYVAALKGDESNLVPGGPGDHLVAAMEGFNFLMSDVVYRPDVGRFLKMESDADATKEYWIENPGYPDEILDKYFPGQIIDVGPNIGRYHRNRWDIQDDTRIMEPKMTRMGFTVEQEAAIFCLLNTGWFTEKYGRESMANSLSYLSDGYYNALANMMADITMEDHVLTFAPYCVVEDSSTNPVTRKIVKVQPPLSATYLWGTQDRFKVPINPYEPPAYSMCDQLSDPAKNLKALPMHAGWIYFDRLTPSFWAMFSMSNTAADLSVMQLFTTDVIDATAYDAKHCTPTDNTGCGPYKPIDPAKEVEFLNVNGRYYFRARKADTLSVVTPAYEAVKQAAMLEAQCDRAHMDLCSSSVITGMEHIEATLLNNNSFAKFWIDITANQMW